MLVVATIRTIGRPTRLYIRIRVFFNQSVVNSTRLVILSFLPVHTVILYIIILYVNLLFLWARNIESVASMSIFLCFVIFLRVIHIEVVWECAGRDFSEWWLFVELVVQVYLTRDHPIAFSILRLKCVVEFFVIIEHVHGQVTTIAYLRLENISLAGSRNSSIWSSIDDVVSY